MVNSILPPSKKVKFQDNWAKFAPHDQDAIKRCIEEKDVEKEVVNTSLLSRKRLTRSVAASDLRLVLLVVKFRVSCNTVVIQHTK